MEDDALRFGKGARLSRLLAVLQKNGLPVKDLLVSKDYDTKKMIGFEKLLVSNTIQLEAITRLLLQKGVIKEVELLDMMSQIQSEYYTDIEI